MRARIVDWSLLVVVLLEIGTGLWSFLIGDSHGRWLFVAHGALGLALLGVLSAKLRRVTPVVLCTQRTSNVDDCGHLNGGCCTGHSGNRRLVGRRAETDSLSQMA